MGGVHPMWQSRIDLEGAVAEKLVLKQARIFIRHDLVVIALQNQGRDGDSLQIVGLVGF